MYSWTVLGRKRIRPIKYCRNLYRYRLIPEKRFLKRLFKRRLGYELNLDDPKTFNEKIQWIKLNDRDPLRTLCTDKLAVREYVKEKIGEQYLIPLVFHTENPADLLPENLPDSPTIIKPNHSSGMVVIVKDKTDIDWKKLRRKLAKSLKSNHYYSRKEWQYKDIKPLLLVEKLLIDSDSNVPADYKFHCFNGRLGFIQVDAGRFTEHTRNHYDPHWNALNFQWTYPKGESIDKPANLDEMKSLAERLAIDFCYVRVDLYNLEGDIYFGELTFTPGAGTEVFNPSQWDRHFGDQLKL